MKAGSSWAVLCLSVSDTQIVKGAIGAIGGYVSNRQQTGRRAVQIDFSITAICSSRLIGQ